MKNISLILCSYNPNLDWLNLATDLFIKKKDKLEQYGLNELIIVDDGSDIPIKNSTIRINKNTGPANGRNIGIQLAKGEIIALLDDDDFYTESIFDFLEFVQNTESDVYHFQIQCFGKYNNLWGNYPDVDNLFLYNTIPGVSWFKKSVWSEVGGYNSTKAEDWYFWCKLKKAQKKFTYYPRPIYMYRKRDCSSSASLNNDTIKETRNLICKLANG